MKALVSVNVEDVLFDALQAATESELITLYDILDNTCVEIENELIELGVWEEDD
jgi:hypothetical protein